MDKYSKFCEFTVSRNKNIEVISINPLYCNYTVGHYKKPQIHSKFVPQTLVVIFVMLKM